MPMKTHDSEGLHPSDSSLSSKTSLKTLIAWDHSVLPGIHEGQSCRRRCITALSLYDAAANALLCFFKRKGDVSRPVIA